MLHINYFEQFRAELLALPILPRYAEEDLKHKRFRIFSEGDLEAYYVPFHYLNHGARLVLVGVTPGWTQMEEAFRSAKRGIAKGLDGDDLFRYIDACASFSGPMRANLVRMLDAIGMHDLLGVNTCNDLFDYEKPASRLAVFESAISAPLFRNGKNYTGYSPRLLKVRKLREWLLENLAAELSLVPESIIVPFGPAVEEAIALIAKEAAVISPDRVLAGFPHPSGGNGHQHKRFREGRERWRQQLAQFR